MASSSAVSDAAYVSNLLSQGVERLEEVRDFTTSHKRTLRATTTSDEQRLTDGSIQTKIVDAKRRNRRASRKKRNARNCG